jgi:glycosyltransferase involved in cell wall biosynthesis
MRLAVVDQKSNFGGVSRFLRALLSHLAALEGIESIDFFVDLDTVAREGYDELLASPKVHLRSIRNATPYRRRKNPNTVADRVAREFRRQYRNRFTTWYKFSVPERVERALDEYDVVYFSWPIFVEPPKIKAPLVCTIHDFNFRHDFAGNFTPEMARLADDQTKRWIERSAVVINSTKFIRDEMEQFYTARAKQNRVVYLAPFTVSEPTDRELARVKAKYKLPEVYALYPGNISAHKNMENLLRAAELLRGKVPLVLSGPGTDRLRSSNAEDPDPRIKRIVDTLRASKLEEGKDIFTLGYVSNGDIDALERLTSVIVSPSLYEAGCGPALEAWAAGTPVAFSNIPAFVEQLDVIGTKAWVFDPNDPQDIAAKIRAAVTEKAQTAGMVKASQQAMEKLAWNRVAGEYLAAFEAAVQGAKLLKK